MTLSPRFRRGLRTREAGTSIIAALVFAAVLGAIALSLNAYNSNSVNTSALPANAAGSANSSSTGSSETNCQDGYDYSLTIGAIYTINSSDIYNNGYSVPTQDELPGTKLKPIPMCPSSTQALNDARVKYLRTTLGGQTVGTLPQTITETPSAQRNQCNAGKQTTSNITCNYKLVGGNSYQLQTAATGQTGPWTCHVSFYNPKGATPIEQCWVKDVPLDSGVNDTPPGSPGSGQVPQTSPTITSDTGLNTAPSVPPTACQPGTYDAYSCIESTYCADYPGQPGCGGTPPSDTANPAPTDTTGLSQNCSWTATAINCTGSSQVEADSMQDNLDDNTNPNYVCNYNESTKVTNCDIDNTSDNSTQTPPPGNSCPAGEIGTPPNCTPSVAAPAGPGTIQTGRPAGNNNSGLGGLTSFLSGLARGLTGAPCAVPTQNPYIGGNGTTLVPIQSVNAYGQVTTMYVQQTPQYQYGGGYGAQPCSNMPQQMPYGVGNNGVACSMPPTQPQCAAGATPQPLSSSGNGCITGYQCVPTNSGGSTITPTPTPSLSCSPQVADVGQSVAISYSCSNATGSSASGFSTNNQTSGTASVTIQTPPSGTNTANFGLTCTNSGQIASAQCKVQINQPAIDLVAEPQSVPSGQTTSIGWVTSGMQSCVVSSPSDSNFTAENVSNTNVNGVAQSDAITGNTEFDLTCQTLGGQTKKASTTVTVGATSTAATVNVTSTADGQSANHGGSITLTWSDSNAATNTAAAIWLIDIKTEQATALIADGQSTSGTYTWHLPQSGSSCDATSYAPCASDLVAGDSYGLEVAMYTPANAYIGPQASAPANSVSPTYTDYGYTANPFSIGQ